MNDASPVRRHRILVVDDEPDVRELCTTWLKDAGYDVVAVDDGDSALAMLDIDPPDAMVLDLMMPRLSGLDVLDALKARGQSPPVVLFTAAPPKSCPVPVVSKSRPLELVPAIEALLRDRAAR